MSDLVENPEDRFSRVAAHLIYSVSGISTMLLGEKKTDASLIDQEYHTKVL